MAITSLGDLAQSAMLRRHNVELRQAVTRHAQEVTTGVASNLAHHLQGDFAYIADIERSFGTVQGYRAAVIEAGTFTAGMQNALGLVQDVGSTLANTLLSQSASGLAPVQSIVAQASRDSFARSVSALNAQTGGRSLFSGTATDSPSLASADTIIAQLRNTIGTETSAAGIQALVEGWFAPGTGDFQSVAYLGATSSLTPFRLDATGHIDLDLRADTPVLRDTLKFNALAVLAGDPQLALSSGTRADLQRLAGEGLLGLQDGLAELRADLGFAESRIEESRTRLESEKTALELARNTLVSIDPYDAATALERTQSQLESLYAVTVRLSRLSLADFLR